MLILQDFYTVIYSEQRKMESYYSKLINEKKNKQIQKLIVELGLTDTLNDLNAALDLVRKHRSELERIVKEDKKRSLFCSYCSISQSESASGYLSLSGSEIDKMREDIVYIEYVKASKSYEAVLTNVKKLVSRRKFDDAIDYVEQLGFNVNRLRIINNEQDFTKKQKSINDKITACDLFPHKTKIKEN